MKVVILAGGFGTRISEESHLRPKPMIEIGGMPILWHIMKIYSHYGFNEFVICCGYKGYMIKEYFADYYLHRSDITFDFADQNKMIIHNNVAEPWKVTLVDTGLNTMTGGRVKRVQPFVGEEPFMLTYGDGLSDVNMNDLLAYHKAHGKTVTMTAVQPGGRWGMLEVSGSNEITSFVEKAKEDGGWINGGFMVAEPELFNYISGDDVVLECGPLETLAGKGELIAYKHDGFWLCMDTQRDKDNLEKLWNEDGGGGSVEEMVDGICRRFRGGFTIISKGILHDDKSNTSSNRQSWLHRIDHGTDAERNGLQGCGV